MPTMTQPFQLGFLTHIEGEGEPPKIYEETLALFVAAEQLGFDSAWIAQHHFKPLAGRLPSPFPFLAAAAQRTKRIRLGTSIVILPLENSLRVAEDAAVVNALSGGRLELGIGSGGDPAEFNAFDVPLDSRHASTTHGIAQLHRAFRGDALNSDGQVLQPPAPELAQRLWQSAVSIDGAQHVARNGAGLMLSRAAWSNGKPTDVVQRPVAEAFIAACDEQQAPVRLALSRGIYPSSDKGAALAALREGVLRSASAQVRQGLFPPGLSLERYCERLHIAYGHPDEVAAFLMADQVLPMATELIVQFSPVIPPLDEAIHTLELMATSVAPALGWQPQHALSS
jgi:alkanesulfonate monooxygenase SsuD/methylene tetrahydromethanopterin reductase-like flavin-dependent oxidoreductase (luciferase family)